MHKRYPTYHGTPTCHPVVHHHVVCRHQIEIEITPENTEVYFADERYVNPINTQVRFDATVYNAPNNSVIWQVSNSTGGPGAGSINPTGLYTAPPKGSIPHGHTDIVIATAKADPTRRAYSKVTLVGLGPEPPPQPKLEIYPQVAYIYYRGTDNTPQVYNRYIDFSNKMQQFRTIIKNTASTNVTWDMIGYGSINNDGVYLAPYEGPNGASATIKAHLTSDSSVKDEAKVILLNYYFIGLD